MKVRNLSNFELSSLLIAGLVSILLVVLMFSNPAYLVVDHIAIDQQGVYVPALIFGAILWGIIVSIHAPVKGATFASFTYWLGETSFNPRTREGCDLLNLFVYF